MSQGIYIKLSKESTGREKLLFKTLRMFYLYRSRARTGFFKKLGTRYSLASEKMLNRYHRLMRDMCPVGCDKCWYTHMVTGSHRVIDLDNNADSVEFTLLFEERHESKH